MDDRKKAFCEECRNDVTFVESFVPMAATLKDKTYHYVGKEARCADCGAELFVPEFIDYNLDVLYDIFHKDNGIISEEQIREIPEESKL